MPDSGAVYQPTTVGYTYDTGGDTAGGGDGIRNAFMRLMSRHKINTRKRIEWGLLAIALPFFAGGLATMLVSLISNDGNDDAMKSVLQIDVTEKTRNMHVTTTSKTHVEEHVEDRARSSIALGAGMTLAGLLLGLIWAWLRFFHRSKSPRNGITGSSGQMLGGLNPSTDLLVGSTSQYGPVLTELPSQLKLMQTNTHDAPAAPLSDQEEETRTLMQDSTIPPTVNVGGPSIVANQIPG